MHADHPRACGANFRPVSRGCSRFGSSPRVRGKRCKLRQLKQQIRIIPARAGQTHERKEMQKRASDHPRACGANDFLIAGANVGCGSSPRVRGKPVTPAASPLRRRIIPARAVQTRERQQTRGHRTDHPRACGANSDGHRGEWGPDGSSPRVRGKRSPALSSACRSRIIPARAGQTRCLVSERQVSPDHPRACGANAVGCPRCRGVRGSSPRVRGKPHGLAIPGVQVRIIPARAGQTSPPIMVYGWPTDHPRACGANYCSARLKSRAHGSSPRVRGKPDRVVRVPDVGRIIPARAGQTMRHRPPNHEHADHPRACGANKAWDGTSAPPDGSSPRVRGKLCDVLGEHARGRIIPARAGQTNAVDWLQCIRQSDEGRMT